MSYKGYINVPRRTRSNKQTLKDMRLYKGPLGRSSKDAGRYLGGSFGGLGGQSIFGRHNRGSRN
jgi:hypothetical protein